MKTMELRSLTTDASSRKGMDPFAPGEPLTVFYDATPLELAAPSGTAANAAASRPTVLLAEDNNDLRQVMVWILEMMGYVVVPCGNAELASETFRSRSDIDLLLTDFEMPGKSGVELARELTALRPSLPIMIVSGSVIPDDLTREMRHQNWSFLPKPFDIPALLAATHLLLHQGHHRAA